MKDGRWGRIVNFGSGSVFQGTAGQSHYAAAKAAALGLTRSLACTGWRSALTASCSASRVLAAPLLRRGPGTSRPGRPAAVQLAGTSLPGASVPCPRVTLSDAGGQGERRWTRRYGDVSNSLRILQESRTKMSRLIGLHGNAGYHDSTARDATSQPRSSKLSITAFAAIMAAPGGLRVPGRHWELQMPVFAVSRA